MVANVDVIIPAYNAARFIEKTILSVLNQQGGHVSKILVVDDGSIDSTSQTVSNLAKKLNAKNLVLLKQENLGASAARNLGLLHAQAEYVAFLDADDVWDEWKLHKQINVFKTTELTNVGLVYCEYNLITDSGSMITNKGVCLQNELRGYVTRKLTYGNRITGSASAVLIRRCFLNGLTFDTSLVCAEDWDLWLRLSELCQFDFVHEALVKIRVHDNNSQNDQNRMLDGELLFLNKLYLKKQLRWSYLIYFRRRLHWARLTGDQLPNYTKCDKRFKNLVIGWRLNYIKIPEFFMKLVRLARAIFIRAINFVRRRFFIKIK